MKKLQPLLLYIKTVDKTLAVLCVVAAAYGLVLVCTATASYGTARYVVTQGAAAAMGLCAFFVVAAMDTRLLTKFFLPILAVNLCLLATLYFWGVGEGSNRSCLRFAGIGVQPAELGKPLFILSFAGHLQFTRRRGMKIRDTLALMAHAGAVCAFVVCFSRDDGMTLAYVFIALFMAAAAGVPGIYFAGGAALTVGAMPLAWTYVLSNYQRQRILAIFNPDAYPDVAYQAEQTVRAFASGGLHGSGYMQGALTQTGLIPTRHTDAILAVAGEELGFIGAAAAIVLLGIIAARCIATAVRAGDSAGAWVSAGVGGMIIFQTVLNAGMNLGVLPVVGLTLPFFSYGGTSVVTMFAAMGLAAGVRREIRKNNINKGEEHEKDTYFIPIERGGAGDNPSRRRGRAGGVRDGRKTDGGDGGGR
jgi:rod shape determining protein RodA